MNSNATINQKSGRELCVCRKFVSRADHHRLCAPPVTRRLISYSCKHYYWLMNTFRSAQLYIGIRIFSVYAIGLNMRVFWLNRALSAIDYSVQIWTREDGRRYYYSEKEERFVRRKVLVKIGYLSYSYNSDGSFISRIISYWITRDAWYGEFLVYKG